MSRKVGVIPRLAKGSLFAGRWMLSHPQPLVVIGLVAVVTLGVVAFAHRAQVFRIAHVHLPTEVPLKLNDPLFGTNIWDVDLVQLAEQLKRQQPSLKTVRVVRDLPNSIRIQIVQRVPLAQVRIDLPALQSGAARQASRWYPVDADGFLLPQGSQVPVDGLIRIIGLEQVVGASSIGKEHPHERVDLALRVIESLRRAPVSISRHVTEVNLADPQQIRFLIDLSAVPGTYLPSLGNRHAAQAGEEMEVRCGSEVELEAHLVRLKEALKTIQKQQIAVRYIDVRFQEPVVSPRT